MIRIAVCDDDLDFAAYMKSAVDAEIGQHTSDKYEIKAFVSSRTLFDEHTHSPFDVVFIDIDMPEMNGFDLASHISDSGSCYIIFVTCHPELVYDSLYFRPLNFITKSLDSFFTDKLHSVVVQLFNEMKQNSSVILENKEVGRIAVAIRDIYYIESSKHYVIYHCKGSEPVKIRGNIGELEEYYAGYDFVRIHKCFLVNLRHVFNVDRNKDELIFKQGFRLNMSKNYKQSVDDKLTEYLRKTK